MLQITANEMLVFLNENTKYDHDNGGLLWSRPLRGRTFNRQIGHDFKRKHGGCYRMTQLFGKTYYVHRLVWLYFHGKWPEDQIDHIDGNGLNNRIENLRDVNGAENKRNRKLQANNKSGKSGVFLVPSGNWCSRIKINGKIISLGTYSDFNEALSVRMMAEKQYKFHENHDRIVE